MGGNNSRPKPATPAINGRLQREVVQPSTQPTAEPQYMTASGIPVVPRTQPSPVVAPDPVLQEFRAAYVKPNRHGSEIGSIASQVVPMSRHPTWFMRMVENHHSKSLIEQLVLETNPQCRLNRLQRLRKIYTNPIVRLSVANRQRIKVIDAQIEELEFLMTNDDGKPFARYRTDADEDPSPPSTQLSGSLEEQRPVPMIAQLADQQASASSDPGSGIRMVPYNRPLKRYLQESPRLPPRHATSSSHIRTGSIRLPSVTAEGQDWADPRNQPRPSNNLSRVSEETSAARVRTSRHKRSGHNHSVPPPSVGPAVVLERDPYNKSLLVPTESARKSTSRSKTSKDASRRSRTTGRVSHKMASSYSEQIDVRPESRNPNAFFATGQGMPST